MCYFNTIDIEKNANGLLKKGIWSQIILTVDLCYTCVRYLRFYSAFSKALKNFIFV